MAKEEQSKLEQYFNALPRTATCCGTPTIHIAQRVYLKCSKCGFPLTKSIPLAEAKQHQS